MCFDVFAGIDLFVLVQFYFVFIVFPLCYFVFGCQYQCNQLPGKTLLRVEWDVKPYTLTGNYFPLCDVFTEFRRDGFGTRPYYQCVVAEQLVGGRTSKTLSRLFYYSAVRSLMINPSVCLCVCPSVCLSVCPRACL